jgi:hypothetical protein
VTGQGSALTRFRRAVERENLFMAEIALREMPHVTLPDALGLLSLYAAAGSPKYEKAASRWLARLAFEQDVSLSDLQLAVAALAALPSRPKSALHTLTELSRA